MRILTLLVAITAFGFVAPASAGTDPNDPSITEPAGPSGTIPEPPEPYDVIPQPETPPCTIRLPGSVLFARDEDTLTDAGLQALDEFVAEHQLARSTGRRKHLVVVGHASSEGPADHNTDLSKRRAESVRLELIELSIKAKRINDDGLGSTRPVVWPERNEQDRSANRRVEITITKKNGDPACKEAL